MSSYPPPAPYSTSSLSHPDPSGTNDKHDLLSHLQSAPSQPYSYDVNTRPLPSFPTDGIPNNNAQQAISNGQQRGSGSAALTDAQKGNRLRKACDSCSIRKVKVSATQRPHERIAALNNTLTRTHSAMKKARLVAPAPPSRSHAHSSARHGAAAPRTGTRRASSGGVWRRARRRGNS